jgi:5-methylcytosine-specific restriction protein A
MSLYGFVDPEHIRRERRKAQELKQSSWWKQQLGRGICYHCGEKFPKDQLTMDHVVPIARGGRSTKKNCVVSCKACNTKKGYLMSVEMTFQEMQERGELGEPRVSEADPVASGDENDPSEPNEN